MAGAQSITDRHLGHKPMFYLPYEAHDGPYGGDSDCKFLSLGWAQFDPRSASLKTWRHTGERWSRQSEELPLHRVVDLVILLASALDGMIGEHLGTAELPPHTFENQRNGLLIQAGTQSPEAFAKRITDELVVRRLRKLCDVLNRMNDRGRLKALEAQGTPVSKEDSFMPMTITEYVRVADRASELGCPIPTGIAILPENFTTAATRQDLLFGSEAATIRKLLKNNDLPLNDLLAAPERVASIHNKHFDWAPLLFISAALLTNNAHAVSVALGVIANYATDFFKGLPGNKVKLNLVIEKRDGSCKKLTYEGNAAGLASLPEIIRRVSDD